MSDDLSTQKPLETQMTLDTMMLEAFIRSTMKPVNNNADDLLLENQVLHSRLPIECVRRLYSQDFHEAFLDTGYLYDLIKVAASDLTVGDKTILTNYVKVSANTENGDLNTAIDTKIAPLDSVTIGKSDFHTCIEFAEATGTRTRGLYDADSLVEYNNKLKLYELGLLETVFDDELKALEGDIENEHMALNFQTIARRVIELFARLSNTRLSMLFYTDDQVEVTKEEAVAALDIFYNMLSKLSDANRVHVSPTGTDDTARKRLAAAAYYNKNVMETTRPSIFVRALVNEMGTWRYAYANNADATAVALKGSIKEKVAKLETDKFKWFSRSTGYDELENNVEPTKRGGIPYKLFAADRLGYVDSLTGIHLGLLGKTTEKIKDLLKRGCDLLGEAFIACFDDPEVLRVFDPVLRRSGNLWNAICKQSEDESLSQSTETTSNPETTSLNNVSDLQYSLVLERIIAKVYSYLHVQHSSYDQGQRPVLNLDFGLRYLTDRCIKGDDEYPGNDLEGYRVVHSTFASYLEYIDNKLPKDGLKSNPFGLTNQEASFIKYGIIRNLTKGVSKGDNPAGENVFNYDDKGGYAHQVAEWSLCPFLQDHSGSDKEAPTNNESKIGSMWDRKYTTNKTSKCPYAKEFKIGETMVTNGCELVVEGKSQEDLQTLWDDPESLLKKIPPTCPNYALIKAKLEKPEKTDFNKTVDDAKQYLTTLFKADPSGNLVYKVSGTELKGEDFKGEKDSLGFGSPEHADGKADLEKQGYKNQQHAPIQLAFLDHIIKLIQILYKVNNYIAFNEPYLRVEVKDLNNHYYGDETHGSFEPITCYRFSNFHELNTYDKYDGGRNQLRFFKKSRNLQWINAINRDLSGDGGLNSDERQEVLDSGRKIPGTSTKEASLCYPYLNYSTDARTGVITSPPTSTVPTSTVPTSVPNGQLYRIHPLSSQSSSQQALYTYQVFVKRFRPIYLPTASELYESDEPADLGVRTISSDTPRIQANGWSIVPHKHSSDGHFTKMLIVIPSNVASHNSPRTQWFNELDWAFWKAEKNPNSEKFDSGCFRHEVTSGDGSWVPVEDFVPTETKTVTNERLELLGNAKSTNEYLSFSQYNRRDWIYPVCALTNQKISSSSHAHLPTILSTDNVTRIKGKVNEHKINKYVDSTLDPSLDDRLTIKPPAQQSGFEVINTDTFDTYNSNADVLDLQDLCCTWLYITEAGGQSSATHMTEAQQVFPWIFWHSARGDASAVGPSAFCYGIANWNRGNEIGFERSQMRFHAVQKVMAQNFKNPNEFYKGAYDPLSCATDNRWHIHGSDTAHLYYGCGNINDNDFCADRYYKWSDGFIWDGSTGIQDDKGNYRWGNGVNKNDKTNFRWWANNAGINGPKFTGLDGEAELRKAADNPLTWSLWNLVRYAIWYNYTVKDLDNEQGGADDRKTNFSQISDDELEEKTFEQMKALYREWWQRFTNNNRYTGQKDSGIESNGAWPYFRTHDEGGKEVDLPKTWLQAQTLGNNTSEVITKATKRKCYVEWTNIRVFVGVMYNEVSDTHNSCLCLYTGAHQHSNAGKTSFDGWNAEFKGWPSVGSGAHDNKNNPNGAAFCYALDEVSRCRNFMLMNYMGYNSQPPMHATHGNGQPLFTARAFLPKTFILTTKVNNVEYTNDNSIQLEDKGAHIRDIYPPSEENDDEYMDMNFYVRRALPVYPNWEVLNDGQHPLHPDSVAKAQLKQVVFCLAPVTYWDELEKGNDGKPGRPIQVGERMMGIQFAQFLIGENRAYAMGGASAEYIKTLSQDTNHVVSDGPTREAWPNQKPWGQGLVDPNNRGNSYLDYVI